MEKITLNKKELFPEIFEETFNVVTTISHSLFSASIEVFTFYIIRRSLQEAVTYTSRPIQVLGIYDTVSMLVNETVQKANVTRIAIVNLMNYVSV